LIRRAEARQPAKKSALKALFFCPPDWRLYANFAIDLRTAAAALPVQATIGTCHLKAFKATERQRTARCTPIGNHFTPVGNHLCKKLNLGLFDLRQDIL